MNKPTKAELVNALKRIARAYAKNPSDIKSLRHTLCQIRRLAHYTATNIKQPPKNTWKTVRKNNKPKGRIYA